MTREIGLVESPGEPYDWEEIDEQDSATVMSAKDLTVGRRTRAMAFLNEWRQRNPQQFDLYVDHQHSLVEALLKREEEGETVELFDRYRAAQLQKRQFKRGAEDSWMTK